MRNTLNALRCDVIMGVAVGDDLVQTTNPYYRTTYALVFRPGSGLDGIDSLEDPRLKGKHIGIVAGTPPATVLVQQGLMALAKPYALTVDTRIEAPTQTMAEDIAAGQIDAGVLWGPIAGYYAQRVTPHLAVAPLLKEQERMDFRIAMGVRRSDQDWKRRLNRLIAENQPEIDRILAEYGVPLLDEQGNLTDDAMSGRRLRRRRHLCCCLVRRRRMRRPSPPDYRMDDYRAPTPATLHGATVLSTDEAHAHWEQHDAVFIDVLPQLPRPAGSAGLDDLAGEAARRHTRQHLAAGYRLRRAGAGDGTVLRARPGSRPAAAIATACSCSTAWRIAGCRGTRRNVRSRSAIRMSPGIRTAPTAGQRDHLPLELRTPLPRPQAAE